MTPNELILVSLYPIGGILGASVIYMVIMVNISIKNFRLLSRIEERQEELINRLERLEVFLSELHE